MPDRPEITNLSIDPNTGNLIVEWGPQSGAWGIFKQAMVATPKTVRIKFWWLMIGTKAKHDQDDKNDEPTIGEIFNSNVGETTTMTVERFLLPAGKKVLVQVIGFFDSEDEQGNRFEEGIYSNVRRIKIPK